MFRAVGEMMGRYRMNPPGDGPNARNVTRVLRNSLESIVLTLAGDLTCGSTVQVDSTNASSGVALEAQKRK
jgi:hypothetical protein